MQSCRPALSTRFVLPVAWARASAIMFCEFCQGSLPDSIWRPCVDEIMEPLPAPRSDIHLLHRAHLHAHLRSSRHLLPAPNLPLQFCYNGVYGFCKSQTEETGSPVSVTDTARGHGQCGEHHICSDMSAACVMTSHSSSRVQVPSNLKRFWAPGSSLQLCMPEIAPARNSAKQ